MDEFWTEFGVIMGYCLGAIAQATIIVCWLLGVPAP